NLGKPPLLNEPERPAPWRANVLRAWHHSIHRVPRSDGRAGICAPAVDTRLNYFLLFDGLLKNRLLERFSVFRLHEGVREADDLKSVAIADEPNMQLASVLFIGRNLDEAGFASNPIGSSIGTRKPSV